MNDLVANDRARETGGVLQALTTGMPQFYRPLGWGVCGRQTVGKILSRNLPQATDGVVEGRGGAWHVRPWRQVELNDFRRLPPLVQREIMRRPIQPPPGLLHFFKLRMQSHESFLHDVLGDR